MRALLVCLMVAACATAPAPPPPERVAGCWIARGDEVTTTMRWLPDYELLGRVNGALLRYGPGEASENANYRLTPRSDGWDFCQLGAGEGAAEACWRVAIGQAGSLEGGRVFIDQHGDRLRIALVSAEGERLIFDGRRDGCD